MLSRRGLSIRVLTAAGIAIGLGVLYWLVPLRTVDVSVAIDPSGRVPLSAAINVTSRIPVKAHVQLVDDQEQRVILGRSWGTRQRLPVFELRPGTQYQVVVTAHSFLGRQVGAPYHTTFKTEPLPDNFPPLKLAHLQQDAVESGVTLFNVFRWQGAETDTSYGLVLAVDDRGEVVWYYCSPFAIQSAQQLDNGHLLLVERWRSIVEIDLLGNVIHEWHPSNRAAEIPERAVPVATDSFHHDVVVLPWENLLTLSTEIRRFDNYYTSEIDSDAPRGPANVIGDVLVEFAPDGSIVDTWQLFDILDPYRISYNSLFNFWDRYVYEDEGEETRGWSHGNGVAYDQVDDAFIISLRHQDAVVKIGRQDKELRWILGDHGNWQEPWQRHLLAPVGKMEWPYHQHAPKVTSRGTILLFDNGNGRAVPFAERYSATEAYSRAVEYEIDEESMTVRQVWSYGGPGSEQFYSPFISEADELPETGNVLITDGGRVAGSDGQPTDLVAAGHHWARIVEVTRTQPAQKIFELVIGDPDRAGSGGGWSVYRSERIGDFFARASHEIL